MKDGTPATIPRLISEEINYIMEGDSSESTPADKEENGSRSSNGNEDEKTGSKHRKRSRSRDSDSPTTEQEEKQSSELKKYWQTVRDNPSDFTGWTYLLQFVEQEGIVKNAREAFDAFFARYPFCYGYWKKYADLEKKNKSMVKCEEVYERGVEAISLSVELWIHYINFFASYHAKDEDFEEKMRKLYKKAIGAVGKEFRSDKLWDKYIDWEMNLKNYRMVMELYDQLLTIPTQLYSHHFENFQTLVSNNHPKDLLSLDDFLSLRKEVVASKTSEEPVADDAPPGDDMPPGVEDDGPPGLSNGDGSKDDGEVKLLKERIIAQRETVHKDTEMEVSKRWSFEEAIRRPYFHVKPLEKGQIRNWKEYLDYEVSVGDHDRIVLLFERCIIACALYEDFWIKYATYMEDKDKSAVSRIYQRACTVHLPTKTYIHLHWAAYEESNGKADKAREILCNIEKQCPGLVMLTMRKISFERRQGNVEAVQQHFQSYIDSATDRESFIYYSLKYARYLLTLVKDHERAHQVLMAAVEKYPDSSSLYLQLIDTELSRPEVDETKVLVVFDMATSSSLPAETKILFSQRKMEFLEDFGTDMKKIMKAYDQHQQFVKDAGNDSAKKRKLDEPVSEQDSGDTKKTKSTEGGDTSTSAMSYSAATADPNTYAYGQWQQYNNTAYSFPPWYGPHSYGTTQ